MAHNVVLSLKITQSYSKMPIYHLLPHVNSTTSPLHGIRGFCLFVSEQRSFCSHAVLP